MALWHDWDRARMKRWDDLITQIKRELADDAPEFLIEKVWNRNAKNVYHARSMYQRHYNGETYQLQIDSHHMFEPGWDTKCIEMLHRTDAGEYSVLTGYPAGYMLAEPENEDSLRMKLSGHGRWDQIFLEHFNAAGWYASQPGFIPRNEDKLTRPFRSRGLAGGFNFSYGHFLLNAGYES